MMLNYELKNLHLWVIIPKNYGSLTHETRLKVEVYMVDSISHIARACTLNKGQNCNVAFVFEFWTAQKHSKSFQVNILYQYKKYNVIILAYSHHHYLSSCRQVSKSSILCTIKHPSWVDTSVPLLKVHNVSNRCGFLRGAFAPNLLDTLNTCFQYIYVCKASQVNPKIFVVLIILSDKLKA